MTAVTNRALEFRQHLSQSVLVADGAMATMLYSSGVFINRCFDELNLSSPDLVAQIHRDYADAGAEILETNTYGANRVRLAGFGFSEKLLFINEAGVRLAREAARGGAFVAGAIGPLGVHLEPLGPTSFAEARAVFREQAEALVGAGVDLLILETFGDLNELREAVLAARQAAGPDLVIVAQLAVDDFGCLASGAAVETFSREMNSWPVDVIGVNCSVGPKTTFEVIEQLARLSSKPLSAMPNAGIPTRVEGRNIYLCSPEYMAQYARRLLLAGVKIIGGCCGTTPDHIKLICSETRSLQLREGNRNITVEVPDSKSQGLAPIPLAEKSKLGAKLAAGKFVTMVEILPPRGLDASREIAGARLCAEHGIDCINVPDGPRASARVSAQATCQVIQQQAGIEAVNHCCCRDRNILGIQSELLGAHAGGVRNLNHGLDIGGNPMVSQTAMLVGVGANPGALNMEEKIRRLDWKVEAGAEYIVTQPVFDLDLLEAFLKRTAHIKIPVICGIWPLTSYRNAEFMVNELRVPVPAHFMERMQRVDNADKAREEGVNIAREMVVRVRGMVQGVQLSAPFGRYQMALDVAEAIGPR